MPNESSSPPSGGPPLPWRLHKAAETSLVFYYLTGAIVALGLVLGSDFLKEGTRRGHTFNYNGEVFANWDGQWYKKIAAEGYSYDAGAHSNVAFFPAYPLLGRLLAAATGLRAEYALLIVSNVAFFLAMMLSYSYLSVRWQGDPAYLGEYSLLAMSIIPTSFFFRMAYSESLFLLATAGVLIAMERRWPLVVVALLVGFATATRPVGIGLIPALALHVWGRHPTPRAFATRFAALLPLACWGLLAYMAYLGYAFGEPLAFSKTQANWAERPALPLGEKIVALATLEPIRRLFDPTTPAYWANYEQGHFPLLSLHVANPFLFLAALGLVAVGAVKRWLSACEWVAAASVILVPYVVAGPENEIMGLGRHTSAALPIYFVLGHLLCRTPAPLAAASSAISGFFLGVYAAMFASWHKFY